MDWPVARQAAWVGVPDEKDSGEKAERVATQRHCVDTGKIEHARSSMLR